MIIQPGEFWVVDILFTNAGGSTRRPVLILWLDANEVVCAAVTTAQPRSSYDVSLTDWKSSGLKKTSTVRLSRLDCLEQSLLVARIGAISTRDGDSIKQVWASHIKPQF